MEAATELLRRRRARASLTEYARYIDVPGAPIAEQDEEADYNGLYVATPLAKHHQIILDATQRCIAKPRGRTMLFLPPGSAKSTYATIVSTTWAMGAHPNFRAITVSYGTDLARKFGRRMRSIAKQQAFHTLFGCELSPESSAADEWALTNGSEFMGGGILSGITGNRADFIAIDDPIKGRQEADSEATRKSTLAAYQEDVLTRLKPQGSLMMTLTRWHEGDLAGAILPEDYKGESGMIECRDGETWEVICIPAKAERSDDLLGRKPGEYIWPEWFPAEHWKTFERMPRTWSALYQQRPAPDTGDYFKREWIHLVPKEPPRETMTMIGGSDYAVTSGGGDFTVHAVLGLDHEGNPWIVDLWREQTASDVWVETFCDLVLKWKPLGWAEETGQIKSSVGPFLLRQQLATGAYVAREKFSTGGGDKAVRAQSFRGLIATKGLYIQADKPWAATLIAEMMSFPVGVHDDQVDALGLIGQLIDRLFPGKAPAPTDTSPKPRPGQFKPPPVQQRNPTSIKL